MCRIDVSQQLIGKDDDGRFRTAVSARYTPLFCERISRSIAHVILAMDSVVGSDLGTAAAVGGDKDKNASDDEPSGLAGDNAPPVISDLPWVPAENPYSVNDKVEVFWHEDKIWHSAGR